MCQRACARYFCAVFGCVGVLSVGPRACVCMHASMCHLNFENIA